MTKVHKVKIAGRMWEYDNVSLRCPESNISIPVRTVTDAWKSLAKIKTLGYNVVCFESTGMIPIFMKVNKLAKDGKVSADNTPVIVGNTVSSISTFNFIF